jgi:hypothetical protein
MQPAATPMIGGLCIHRPVVLPHFFINTCQYNDNTTTMQDG